MATENWAEQANSLLKGLQREAKLSEAFSRSAKKSSILTDMDLPVVQIPRVRGQTWWEYLESQEVKTKAKRKGERLKERRHKRAVEYLRAIAQADSKDGTRNTSCERKLQSLLSSLQVDFVTHFRIGPYEADVWISSTCTVLEADGDYWHSLPGAKEKDRTRDRYMIDRGIRVFRFTETELKTLTADELAKIL